MEACCKKGFRVQGFILPREPLKGELLLAASSQEGPLLQKVLGDNWVY